MVQILLLVPRGVFSLEFEVDAMTLDTKTTQPTRDEVNQMTGPVMLEFGATWCGHCQAIAPHLDRLLQNRPQIRHIKVEDGPGKRLGRSFRVKLWPTLVLMRDGQVIEQLVRPEPSTIADALAKFDQEQPNS